MIGLIILLVAGIYLLAWIALVVFSYRATLRQGHSKKIAFSVGSFFFLVMYLIPFWDLIPTLLVHKYYCSTEAGFTVYKSPEEWIVENPGLLEKLTPYEKSIHIDSPIGKISKKNDRFGRMFEITKISDLPIKKQRTIIVDIDKNEIIVENIDFTRGYGQFNLGHDGYWKFWLFSQSCYSGDGKAVFAKKIRGFHEFLNMTRS